VFIQVTGRAEESRSVVVMPHRLRHLLVYSLLGVWACVCLFPLYWVAATSLKGPLEIVAGPFYLPFVDYAPSLDPWRYILFDSNDHPLRRHLNSAVVAFASTALTVLFAALAIYGLTRYRRGTPWLTVLFAGVAVGMAGSAWFVSEEPVRLAFVTAALAASLGAVMIRRAPSTLHKNGITLAILATRLVPPVVIVLPVYLMAQHTGMLDTRSALVFVYTASNLPVAMWLLQPILGAAATDLEEAAELDGASRLRILFDVVIPAAAPGVIAAGALVFLLCWNEYLFAVYLAPDRAMTMPPFLAAQMSVREQQAGSDPEEVTHLAAAIVLMITPLVFCAGLAQRFLGRAVRQ